MTEEQRRWTFTLGFILAQVLESGLTEEQIRSEIEEGFRGIRLARTDDALRAHVEAVGADLQRIAKP
jgi:hypothetical protein